MKNSAELLFSQKGTQLPQTAGRRDARVILMEQTGVKAGCNPHGPLPGNQDQRRAGRRAGRKVEQSNWASRSPPTPGSVLPDPTGLPFTVSYWVQDEKLHA